MTISGSSVRKLSSETRPSPPGGPTASQDTTFDPLRFCIFTTVALLGWVLGPLAVVWMAGLGLVAYTRSWRAGLRRSKCFLRDTRLVIGYLAVSMAVGGAFAILQAVRWLG